MQRAVCFVWPGRLRSDKRGHADLMLEFEAGFHAHRLAKELDVRNHDRLRREL
jgi:hypothetical protein